MALSPKRSAAAANAACDAMTALLNVGGAGTLKIYDNTAGVPSTVATAITTQVLLGTLTLSSTSFGASSAGVATANTITGDTSADATGTASFFRLLNNAGTAVIQGLCGTSGSDLNLNTLSIVSGADIEVTSLTLTEGM